MEPIDESMEFSQERLQQQQPADLLENSWFFNNLFITKKNKRPSTTTTIIPRCYSDPSSSSSSSNNFTDHQDFIFPGKSMEETFSAINKQTGSGRRSSSQPAGGGGLMRAESAPQRVVRKSSLQRCSNNLSRAPSLPASMAIGDEIQDEEENDFSMSRLIRQASLNQSDLLPPRASPKVVAQSNSTPKQRTRTKLDSETVNRKSSGSGSAEGGVRRRQQHLNQNQNQNQMNPTSTNRLGRSSSDMGYQEFYGFKDLSIEKNKKASSSSSAKEWPEQSTSSSSEWVDRRSVEEDMKAQIKFWARAVASNVK